MVTIVLFLCWLRPETTFFSLYARSAMIPCHFFILGYYFRQLSMARWSVIDVFCIVSVVYLSIYSIYLYSLHSQRSIHSSTPITTVVFLYLKCTLWIKMILFLDRLALSLLWPRFKDKVQPTLDALMRILTETGMTGNGYRPDKA